MQEKTNKQAQHDYSNPDSHPLPHIHHDDTSSDNDIAGKEIQDLPDDRTASILEAIDNVAYNNNKVLVTSDLEQDRPRDFAVMSVNCTSQPPLFDSFSVEPSEIKALALTTKYTISKQDIVTRSTDTGKQVEVLDGPEFTENNTIGNALSQNNLPLSIYDMALLAAQNQLIDEKLIRGVFEKQKLVPPPELLKAEKIWTDDNTKMSLKLTWAEHNLGKVLFNGISKTEYEANREEIEKKISMIIKSQYQKKGLTEFTKRLNEIVPNRKIREQYFGSSVTLDSHLLRTRLTIFLRDNAEIDKAKPPLEVAVDIGLQEYYHNKYSLASDNHHNH